MPKLIMLVKEGMATLFPVPARVAIHDSCNGRALGASFLAEQRALLERLGAAVGHAVAGAARRRVQQVLHGGADHAGRAVSSSSGGSSAMRARWLSTGQT